MSFTHGRAPSRAEQEAKRAMRISMEMNGDLTKEERAMRSHEEERERGRVRFDPTIKPGDVFTIVAMLGAVSAAWSNLDKRTALTEQAQTSTTATVQEIRKDVKDIQTTVNEIRVNRKEDRR